jgi:undecaprenyl-diphosphatase
VALVLGSGAPSRTRAFLAGGAAGIAVLVACSRVFLGAHWTSDVIGGLMLGWIWFGLVAVAFGGRVLRLGAPAREAPAVERTDSA